MNTSTLIMEYEEMLLGKRSSFTPAVLQSSTPDASIAALLRYVFRDLLGWSPGEAKEGISEELLLQLHLEKAVKCIRFPPELDPQKDLFYLAHLAFPKELPLDKASFILSAYKRILSGELPKIPKNFFQNAEQELYVAVCLQYALNTFCTAGSIRELYRFFADEPKCRAFLKKARLDTVCGDFFEHPLDMLQMALPKSQRDTCMYYCLRFLLEYQKYRKGKSK